MVGGRVHARVAQLGRQPIAGLALVRVHDTRGALLRLNKPHQVLYVKWSRLWHSLSAGTLHEDTAIKALMHNNSWEDATL